MSVLLYYGNSSPEVCREFAQKQRGVKKYLEGGSLRVEDCRDLLEWMSIPSLQDRKIVMIGPIEEISIQCADVLLKSFEENDPEDVMICIWCYELENVRPTLRSRCLLFWCHGDEKIHEPLYLEISKFFAGGFGERMEGLKNLESFEKSGLETKDVMRALAYYIRQEENLRVWGVLRKLLFLQEVSWWDLKGFFLSQV